MHEPSDAVYARLEEGFYAHPKVLAVSLAAVGLYTRALSYAVHHLTDGVIARGVAAHLSGPQGEGLVAELVRERLWDATETGFVIHDFLKHNLSGEDVRQGRIAARERMQRHRSRERTPNERRSSSSSDARASLAEHRVKEREEGASTTSPPAADATSKANAAFMAGRDFDAFWELYPRKVGKPDAQKAWRQTEGARPAMPVLMASVQRQKRSEQWRDSPRFIPHPATWLRRHGWEDQTPEEISKAARTARQVPARAIPDDKPARSPEEVASVAQILDEKLPWLRR